MFSDNAYQPHTPIPDFSESEAELTKTPIDGKFAHSEIFLIFPKDCSVSSRLVSPLSPSSGRLPLFFLALPETGRALLPITTLPLILSQTPTSDNRKNFLPLTLVINYVFILFLSFSWSPSCLFHCPILGLWSPQKISICPNILTSFGFHLLPLSSSDFLWPFSCLIWPSLITSYNVCVLLLLLLFLLLLLLVSSSVCFPTPAPLKSLRTDFS